MEAGARIRIWLASGVVTAAGLSIALAGTVQAGDPAAPLMPDLRTVAAGPDPLKLKAKGDGSVVTLRISNRIANKGSGPLELYATGASSSGGPGGNTDCTVGEYPQPVGADRDANQTIFEDTDGNGSFNRALDQVSETPKVGCFEYHQAHDHWHFQDFSQYRLDDVATGDPVAGPSRKVGFCILDADRKYPGIPGSPSAGVYPENTSTGLGCGFGNPEDGPGAMGLSAGWADTYGYSLAGQRLDITGVPAGTYCLVSIANPAGGASEIEEATTANNERRRAVMIDPAGRKARFTGAGCPDPTP